MRYFRIPSFTGIEAHRDDADRGSLRVVEGCLPHGPGGVRSGPVWEEVGEVDMFSETEYNMISASDDGRGNSLMFVSRMGEISDIAILSTENTEVGPFGANYLVSNSTVHSQKTGAIAPIGNRMFAVGDGSAEAIYIGKGPPTAPVSVFPDEVLYRQEWSRFPSCKFYARGPNKTIYAAGNPDKPLTVYISEPAGITNPHADSPYSTELTAPANKPGTLSTVDILGSEAEKITALSSSAGRVIVHTDKGCHVLYPPNPDQASTGYRVEQVPSSVFSAAVNSRVATCDNGSMIYWFGCDGQIYKDESSSRGSDNANKLTDPDQASWKSKGLWESFQRHDLSDSFSFYDPQSGYYWVFLRSSAYIDAVATDAPARPTDLIANPEAPDLPTSLTALPEVPAIPRNLQASRNIPAPPTNLTASSPLPQTGPSSLRQVFVPSTGPSNLTLATAPVSGPSNLNLTTAPSSGPSNLTLATAPVSGPSNLTATVSTPAWTQNLAQTEMVDAIGHPSLMTTGQTVHTATVRTCGASFSSSCPVKTSSSLASTGDGTPGNAVMTAWYPDIKSSSNKTAALATKTSGGSDLHGVWSDIVYDGTKNNDDLITHFGSLQWDSNPSGTQHSWKMDLELIGQWLEYAIVFDPLTNRYVVRFGSYSTSSRTNFGTVAPLTLTKVNTFNNALEAHNPFGTYFFDNGQGERYGLHVGTSVQSSQNLGTYGTGTPEYHVRFLFPNATVNGVQVDCWDMSVDASF